VKPGTYEEIMGRIRQSKKDDLARSARLPFSEKLALTAAASRSAGTHLILRENLRRPAARNHQAV